MKDKFKAMVERAIENGWYDSKRNDKIVAANDVLTDSITGITTITIMIVTVYAYGEVESYYKYTVSDILFNHEFMRALLGEKGCKDYDTKGCEVWCNTKDNTPVCFMDGCTYGDGGTSRYIHGHLQRIVEVSMLPTDQQRIDCVHGLIKGESE